MSFLKRVAMAASLLLTAALLTAAPAAGQAVTTGSISGTVVDQQAGALPGAVVLATNTQTGTTFQAVTQTDGRYTMLNVRVGSYNVKATMSGFKDEEQKDLVIGLGQNQTVNFKLSLAAVTQNVTVTGEAPPIDTMRAGTAANISETMKNALPTISRGLADIVRVNPLFNSIGGTGGDSAQSVVLVAGTTFRYNSLQIDGASNNDLFGLNGSAGIPGGNTGTQPISLDAIQEIQLVVSPYDVRQGGFSGGGINVVTKSGTNALHGTGFFFGRSQNWVGKYVTATNPSGKISAFTDKQGGFSLGGPIARNKAFFFGTLDDQRKLTPTGVSVASTGGTLFGNEPLVDQFLSILQNTYGYNPGPNPKAEFSRASNSDKIFVRADINVAKGHQLTIRHNYVGASIDSGFPSATSFFTPDHYYHEINHTNSTVGQLNSTFGTGVNELRVAYTSVEAPRAGQPFEQKPFPQVTVVLTGSTTIVAGRESASMANEIDQHIIELTDSYTKVSGNHTLTFGTHDEFFKFRDLFITNNFGTYRFSSLANFQAGLAQQYDYSFSASSDPLQAPTFRVNQIGLYAGDSWRARRNVTVTAGVRFDLAHFPDIPHANPVAVTNFGYRTDVVPNNSTWSPRLGINWDPAGDGKMQVRGGLGAFTGRPAYVWIMNQFGNTGVDFTRIGASNNANNKIPFTPGAPSPVVTGATAGSFTNEIDLIDPNFKYPRVLRGNIALDHQLPWGMVGTFEYVGSKTLEDIVYKNLNYAPSSTITGIGGRPFLVKQVSSLSNVIFLGNTTQGHNWTLSYEARKTLRGGFFSAAYSYGQAFSVIDTTSDQAASVWQNAYVPGNSNDMPLARSTYDPGHRINLSGSYDVPVGHGLFATASLFYSGQSGRPYSLVFFPDVNGDTAFNDLFYIPSSATDQNLTYTGGTYQDLINFINADSCLSKYIGQIVPRNACRSPWKNTLDGRVAVKLPVSKANVEITLDMLNLLNLVSSSHGQILFNNFAEINAFSTTPSSPTAASPITGYNLATLTTSSFVRAQRDDLRSRWQLQLGARVRF